LPANRSPTTGDGRRGEGRDGASGHGHDEADGGHPPDEDAQPRIASRRSVASKGFKSPGVADGPDARGGLSWTGFRAEIALVGFDGGQAASS